MEPCLYLQGPTLIIGLTHFAFQCS